MCTSHDVENETEKVASRDKYRLANWPHYAEEMHFAMGSGVAVDQELLNQSIAPVGSTNSPPYKV